MNTSTWTEALKIVIGVLVLAIVLVAYAQPKEAPPLNVGPLRPATADENRQWQRDRLIEDMEATR